MQFPLHIRDHSDFHAFSTSVGAIDLFRFFSQDCGNYVRVRQRVRLDSLTACEICIQRASSTKVTIFRIRPKSLIVLELKYL